MRVAQRPASTSEMHVNTSIAVTGKNMFYKAGHSILPGSSKFTLILLNVEAFEVLETPAAPLGDAITT